MSYRDLYRMENQLTGFSVFEVLWQIQKLMTDRWIIFLLGQWSKIEKSGGMERCDVVHWKSKEDLSDFSGKLWLIGGDWNMNGLFFPVSWEFHHPNSWTHIFQDGYCTSNQLNMGMGPQVLTTNEDQITVISPTAIVSNVRMPISWANHVDVGIFHGRYPLVN